MRSVGINPNAPRLNPAVQESECFLKAFAMRIPNNTHGTAPPMAWSARTTLELFWRASGDKTVHLLPSTPARTRRRCLRACCFCLADERDPLC